MKGNPFVHLHLHTCYSLLDGACHIAQIMDRAAEDGMPAVAMTDHGVLYGTIDFYKAAKAKGLKPIIGCEAYVTNGSRFDRKEEGSRSETHHLVLLAENEKGYENLMRLISAAHLEGFYYKPRVDKQLLAERHQGLIALSACLKGEVAGHLAHDELPQALKVAGEYADIFGKKNFFIEVQDHRLPEQQKANRLMREVSKRTGIPLVANKTNLINVTATTTSWSAAYGGNTTFNDTLTVIQSALRVTLTWQGSEALLKWSGGGPPYRVQRATDLAVGDWTDYLTNVVPPVTVPFEGSTGFYRLVGQ